MSCFSFRSDRFFSVSCWPRREKARERHGRAKRRAQGRAMASTASRKTWKAKGPMRMCFRHCTDDGCAVTAMKEQMMQMKSYPAMMEKRNQTLADQVQALVAMVFSPSPQQVRTPTTQRRRPCWSLAQLRPDTAMVRSTASTPLRQQIRRILTRIQQEWASKRRSLFLNLINLLARLRFLLFCATWGFSTPSLWQQCK